MGIHFVPNPPWCAGRGYPNAVPPSKVWCIVRPPPHYWQTQIDGFTGALEFMNGVRTFRYHRYTDGKRPVMTWRGIEPTYVEDRLRLEWTPNVSGGAIIGYFMVVQFTYPSFSHRISFARHFADPIIDWDHMSDLVFEQVETGPLYEYGDDITVSLRLGTYDVLPAHSCRGDYNGEWP